MNTTPEEAARLAVFRINARCGNDFWNQQDKTEVQAIILAAFAPVLAQKGVEITAALSSKLTASGVDVTAFLKKIDAAYEKGKAAKYATSFAPPIDRRKMMLDGDKKTSVAASYAALAKEIDEAYTAYYGEDFMPYPDVVAILAAFAPVLATERARVNAATEEVSGQLLAIIEKRTARGDALREASRKTSSCLAEWQKFARELGMVLGCCGITDDLLAKTTALRDDNERLNAEAIHVPTATENEAELVALRTAYYARGEKQARLLAVVAKKDEALERACEVIELEWGENSATEYRDALALTVPAPAAMSPPPNDKTK